MGDNTDRPVVLAVDALQKTSAALARAKKRMELELNVGRDIQQSMLPADIPHRKEVTLCAISPQAHNSSMTSP